MRSCRPYYIGNALSHYWAALEQERRRRNAELSQIRDAVVSALAAEGWRRWTPTRTSGPGGMAPGGAVAVETAESRTVGFCNYLGEVFDTGAGAPRELYGKRLEAVISIEIRGQRAADCEQGCETAAEVLLGRSPPASAPVS